MAKYVPDKGCFDAANAASGERLTRDEIEAAFQRVHDHRERLKAAGAIDGTADRLRAFAEREAERTKIAAAMSRRHAALNILVRDRMDQSLRSMMESGLTARQALLAVMEGTQRGIEGGRNSVGALGLAYEARYMGGLMADLMRDRPHLAKALRDPRLDADIVREMSELKDGGKPGITGNADAQYVAKVFATYAELARTDLNKLGASIGKLDGWAGVQTHDDMKMIKAGKDAWIAEILPKLDVARTFPDAASGDEIVEALGGIYDTIITGLPNKPTPKERGQRVNPANMAKSLGKSRVLHFANADAALAYRDKFGHGNTVSGMIDHLRRSSRMAAAMEALGPNPEVMFGALAESLKRRIKDHPTMSPETKAKQIAELDTEAGALRHALDIATGAISRPVRVTGARIGSDIRAVQSMAKLGAATISSLSDTVTVGIASMFRGSGFVRGFTNQIGGMMQGRPKGEQAEIASLIGEGFDGLIGHIVAPAAAVDGPVGKMARLQEHFFRFNGLTWWTDVGRSVAGRTIAAEMGMRSKAAFADLPDNYRHVLTLHGIGADKWEAIRKANFRVADGRTYVTPDRIRDLPDEAIEPLVAGRIAAAKASSRGRGKFEERRASIIEDGRRDLELSVLRFIADETNYGMIEVDARSRRTTSWGHRPGTLGGEAIRFAMQFKSFPITFTQRSYGRALYGHRNGASKGERAAAVALVAARHIGALTAGLTLAGYVSMTMKDLFHGYWPPRDPTDPNTWVAALLQGGAAGLYGDFLFGEVNRFGGGVLETLAGPAPAAGASLAEIAMRYRSAAMGKITGEEAKAPHADLFNEVWSNLPYANLFYAKPALDFLILNSMRDAISPGYLKRRAKRREKDFGQSLLPPLAAAGR